MNDNCLSYRLHKPDTYAFRMEKCLSSTHVNIKNIYQMITHHPCVNINYTKFAYNEMKAVGVTDYTNQTPPTHFGWKKYLSQTPVKMGTYLSDVHKIESANFQYVNSHYAKFE